MQTPDDNSESRVGDRGINHTRDQPMAEVRKAAILIRSLDKKLAAQVMSQLPPRMLSRVTEELSRKEDYPPQESLAILDEFYELAAPLVGHSSKTKNSVQTEEDGPTTITDQRQGSIEDPSPQAKVENDALVSGESFTGTEASDSDALPFGFLNSVGVTQLQWLLDGEHAQMIALVVSHLPNELATEFLGRLHRASQSAVSQRMTQLTPVSAEVITLLEDHLRERFASMEGASAAPGVAFDGSQKPERTTPQDWPAVPTPSRTENEVGTSKCRFEILWRLEPHELCHVIQIVGCETLARSLYAMDDAATQQIVAQLPPVMRNDYVRSERGVLPVRLNEIDHAQYTVEAAIDQLVDAGVIRLLQG